VAAKLDRAEASRSARATTAHAASTVLRPPTHAKPVFVDTTGKRRRWIRRGSVAVGTVLTAYGVVVALSFLGGPVPPNALLPLPGVPGATTPPGGAASPGAAAGGVTTTASGQAGTAATPRAGAGPSASPQPSGSGSAGASPTSTRRVPPGLAGKSASPGSGNGHGR